MSKPRPPMHIVVAPNGATIELELFGELYMPKPERAHDVVDLAARRHECPVCFGRFDMPCWWAEARAVRGHHSHPARRELATAEEIAWYAARLPRLR